LIKIKESKSKPLFAFDRAYRRFAGKTLTRDFLDKLDCPGTLWKIIEVIQELNFPLKNGRRIGKLKGKSREKK